VLTDPVLRSRVAHLRRHAPAPSLGEEPIDAVLLSHLHSDHADRPSLRRLGRSVPVFVPRGAGRSVRSLGVRDVHEVGTGDTVAIAADMTARAVPATHDGRRWPFGPHIDAVGWVLEGERRVYFAGDTDVYDEMAGMADAAHAVDVALLPVWGYGRTMGPGHMDPAEAARATALIRPGTAIPIHWGTFLPIGVARRHPTLLTRPGLAFAELCADAAPDTEVVVLRPTERFELAMAGGDHPARTIGPAA
jgi:L-ascorbate metabolism protein UlaG (beta-lactamase superfamily)